MDKISIQIDAWDVANLLTALRAAMDADSCYNPDLASLIQKIEEAVKAKGI